MPRFGAPKQPSVVDLDFGFPIQVEYRPRRKHVAIRISYGEVVVLVPRTMSGERVKALLATRVEWIRRKLNEQADHKRPVPKRFEDGESFLYLGCDYPLQFVAEARVMWSGSRAAKDKVRLHNERIQVQLPANLQPSPRRELVKKRLTAWYRERALAKLTERSRHYAQQLDLKPRAIRIRSYKARWGTCDEDNNITYNWFVVMAPLEVLDYVVVHELCHIIHHDHSPKYWAEVVKVLPDYKERSSWLQRNSDSIKF